MAGVAALSKKTAQLLETRLPMTEVDVAFESRCYTKPERLCDTETQSEHGLHCR